MRKKRVSNLKIELTTADLVDLLKDKNGDILVEVKDTVIQQFSKRYLKGVFDDSAKNFITDEVLKLFVTYSGFITPEAKQKIAGAAEKAQGDIVRNILITNTGKLQDALEKNILEIIGDAFNSDKVNIGLRAYVDERIKQEIDKVFEDKYKEIIIAKLKEKL